MDFPSIADAVAKATPDVAELLDRHARWSAQMCRNVPSLEGRMFQNVPSDAPRASTQTAEMFPNAPESSGMFHRHETCKTNPLVYRPKERPLTYRQLACARLMVRGSGSLDIAHHLGVEHHTIARWKRDPAFRIELERLRAQLTAAAVTRTPPARPHQLTPAPVRMTRQQIEQEDRECDAMIAQMLRAKGVGRP
jgi:hypothetical protein